VRVYTLEEKHNKTANSTTLDVNLVFSLLAEVPQAFGKFGAVMESDGINRLWISSGWANEEDGVLWSYNVNDGLSKYPYKNLVGTQDVLQEVFKNPPKEHDDFEIASVFAEGSEPKVYIPLCLAYSGSFWGFFACGRFQ
jgi:hypothetical protein